MFRFEKRTIFQKKNEAMNFSFSLVIYLLMSYMNFAFVFSQTFISFEETKLFKFVKCKLSLAGTLPIIRVP